MYDVTNELLFKINVIFLKAINAKNCVLKLVNKKDNPFKANNESYGLDEF